MHSTGVQKQPLGHSKKHTELKTESNTFDRASLPRILSLPFCNNTGSPYRLAMCTSEFEEALLIP
jgi:hypothetical protein